MLSLDTHSKHFGNYCVEQQQQKGIWKYLFLKIHKYFRILVAETFISSLIFHAITTRSELWRGSFEIWEQILNLQMLVVLWNILLFM